MELRLFLRPEDGVVYERGDQLLIGFREALPHASFDHSPFKVIDRVLFLLTDQSPQEGVDAQDSIKQRGSRKSLPACLILHSLQRDHDLTEP